MAGVILICSFVLQYASEVNISACVICHLCRFNLLDYYVGRPCYFGGIPYNPHFSLRHIHWP